MSLETSKYTEWAECRIL